MSNQPVDHCRVYWGSHGCRLPRGHDVNQPHRCEDGCPTPDGYATFGEDRLSQAKLYAWHSTKPPTPERAERGCPHTEWVHEGHPPWRVIVSIDPDTLKTIHIGDVVEYTGNEPTVTFAEWLNTPRTRDNNSNIKTDTAAEFLDPIQHRKDPDF